MGGHFIKFIKHFLYTFSRVGSFLWIKLLKKKKILQDDICNLVFKSKIYLGHITLNIM